MVPRKTRYKRLDPSEKPILPILVDIIPGAQPAT